MTDTPKAPEQLHVVYDRPHRDAAPRWIQTEVPSRAGAVKYLLADLSQPTGEAAELLERDKEIVQLDRHYNGRIALPNDWLKWRDDVRTYLTKAATLEAGLASAERERNEWYRRCTEVVTDRVNLRAEVERLRDRVVTEEGLREGFQASAAMEKERLVARIAELEAALAWRPVSEPPEGKPRQIEIAWREEILAHAWDTDLAWSTNPLPPHAQFWRERTLPPYTQPEANG